MRDTYLSIDLDFFDCVSDGDAYGYMWGTSEYKKYIRMSRIRSTLFNDILSEKIPINIMVHHDHMVPFINNSGCCNIINMDYHSDLTTEPREKVTEGSVFDFVEHKESKTYTWLMPSTRVGVPYGLGRCDDRYDKRGNPIDIFKKRYWVYMHQKKTINRKVIDLDKVKEVGVCISPRWITINSADFIKNVIIPLASKEVIKLLKWYPIN